MAIISKKKIVYEIQPVLTKYLRKYERLLSISIEYNDLLRYDNSIPLYDSNDKDTCWETVFYPQSDMQSIHYDLKKIYALMNADGDLTVMDHLVVDRVDICTYGNTKPFRVRIVNLINDNFDYFYVKNADASRIYGLELEHLLSPNRINYGVYQNTLIEEHIIGVPGDQFIDEYIKKGNIENEIRLAKEFIKFNERCFVRLLGDMHSSNFVVNIIPDFEQVSYRFRAIDFDQQCYEGRRNIYLPQYFKQNKALIDLGLRNMTPKTALQYQKEERSRLAYSLRMSRYRVRDLIHTLMEDNIAPQSHIDSLAMDLAKYYDEPKFLKCKSMGEILKNSLWMPFKRV